MTGAINKVVTTLYEDIVLGIFPPGNKLIEERLASRFGVKRHTVREAFVHLEEIGYVERVPNRGVFVREMTPTEVREIYEVRAILETAAAGMTPLPAPGAVVKQLGALHKQHAKAIRDGDYRSVLHLNTEFHRVQFSACSNTTLVEAIEDYATRVHVITAMKFGESELMDMVVDHHREIIAAMKGKSQKVLVDIVRRHFDLRRVEDYAHRYRMKYGDSEPAPPNRRRMIAR